MAVTFESAPIALPAAATAARCLEPSSPRRPLVERAALLKAHRRRRLDRAALEELLHQRDERQFATDAVQSEDDWR